MSFETVTSPVESFDFKPLEFVLSVLEKVSVARKLQPSSRIGHEVSGIISNAKTIMSEKGFTETDWRILQAQARRSLDNI